MTMTKSVVWALTRNELLVSNVEITIPATEMFILDKNSAVTKRVVVQRSKNCKTMAE